MQKNRGDEKSEFDLSVSASVCVFEKEVDEDFFATCYLMGLIFSAHTLGESSGGKKRITIYTHYSSWLISRHHHHCLTLYSRLYIAQITTAHQRPRTHYNFTVNGL